MRWHVLDANEAASSAWKNIAASVVGQWLNWEIDRSAATRADDVADADAIFLVHSGSVDWLRSCRSALRRAGVGRRADRRGPDDPLVVTGGPIDAAPATALQVADALAVGEAYRLTRALLAARTPTEALDVADASPHALTRRAWDPADRDPDRPWLMRTAAGPLAEPDPWIDWDVPDVRSDDGVIRVIASKGCQLKCGFCATTFRQGVARSDDARLIQRVRAHAGDRVQLLSNDPLNVPAFRRLQTRLDHASLTVMELADDANRAAVIRSRPRVVRVGVEGVSPRIRAAFGKPIPDDELLAHLATLHANRIHTHSFWITGAPFETPADWADWWTLWDRLTGAVDWGMHRAKLTCFTPTPPAPLARWLPPHRGDIPDRADILDRRTASPHLRRILIVTGGRTPAWRRRCGDQYGVRPDELPWHATETVDLAPTVDDYRRLPAEVIAWPIPPHRRWKMADLYRTRMLDTTRPVPQPGRRRRTIPAAAA